MFRLEKVFQQDDYFFIKISIFFKSLIVFLSIYIFSILEFNSIFDLFNYNIYNKSKYFYLSLYFPFFFLLFSLIFETMKKKYITNFSIFLLNDIVPLVITIPFCLYVFFILKIDFNIDINSSYLLMLIICYLFIFRKFLDFFYQYLMNNNIIQRNIMLAGSIESIEKILKEKKDQINIYKCCLIKTDDKGTKEKARMLLKIPVFTEIAELKSIFEYHELGQIWILEDNNKNLVNYFLDLVINFSVDILIINFINSSKPQFSNLVNNTYGYSNFQTSRFFGFNLFIKLLLDKILSILFLLLLSPIFVLAIIFILIEDGFPIFSLEQSIGWDGRRFVVYKLRIFKNDKFGKNVTRDRSDIKILNIGKFLKRLHIDEIPQFFNILKGDMSIVGPRPHILSEELMYSKVFKRFLKRNKTVPGLTGWAQVNGFRGDVKSSDHMQKRMEHDLWYMNNWNIWLDILIIFKTFFILFTKPKK